MIGMLKGKVWEIQGDKLILDCLGVGYQISAPSGLLSRAQVGQEFTLYTHLIVREDEMSLYGFSSAAEKELFLMLLSVSGVGPKVGLAILSTLGTLQTESAIANGDVKTLTKVPGVGKKTAQRSILELKDKFKDRVSNSENGDEEILLNDQVAQSEAMETLLALGFSQEEAKKALQGIKEPQNLATEEQVRLALRALAAGK